MIFLKQFTGYRSNGFIRKNNISDLRDCFNIKENFKYFKDDHSYPLKFQVKSLRLIVAYTIFLVTLFANKSHYCVDLEI